MTFKKRLWSTITLTILIFLIRLNSAPLLRVFGYTFSKAVNIYDLSLLVVFIPLSLFIIQSILHYLFKKEYPVQDRKIKHPVLCVLGYIIILVATILFYFLDYLDRTMHSDYITSILIIIGLGILFLMPFYWIWFIKELKANYGTPIGICSFCFVLMILILYAQFSRLTYLSK